MNRSSHLTPHISLGFSPCPNDCFMFDAMIHKKIDTEGLAFDVVMEDVETLNKKAFAGDIDVTKLSYHAYGYLTDNYILLDSGSALGNRVGPLLISKVPILNPKSQIPNLKIAIPGKYTTANFLFSLAFPKAVNKIEMLFSKIEDAILNGKVDAGVIIHENRFTYEQKGLKKIMDLGEYWETLTGCPIPLGGIAIKRTFSDEIKAKLNRVLKKSIEFAFANPDSSSSFVKENSQEMKEEVMRKHINLYVNTYSVSLGDKGKEAVIKLFEKASELKLIPPINQKIFIEP